ncbi:uncharacterized protein DDB_G0283697-like isoform X2 [Abrus precatorius]|uniref:Uncharacterized protein DDB_G0283697-like isoform X2 n=1 Tax=Abrus precatorius TaxID=3816 RepID=A0A8B8MF41_ABRPR|nr:uncharacterized protein DDB_G0283697-like isoform X2 [Abrus precatorius]
MLELYHGHGFPKWISSIQRMQFDSKRFCRDCRRNVIREFKELKELKRMRREPRCTSWFCVADTAFQYEVSIDSIQADWRQTFGDAVGSYHHFEWAVGTTEGKSDILEFENVGMNGCVQVSGLDLGGLSACFITLRAWKQDGRCTELSVKAHALKGQRCVHCRLFVGDGYVTITKGESMRRSFEHAEEAEEEDDDDLMDKDGNELEGECSRPQKHAKSPELAREFLLDAATVIFKEQVEKAFREGTARQNAHSIFVCLALKLLEERVHVACKEIITLEKQMKLLEEEEKEKREEEERKERKRTKEREKKLRRKERLKEKERDKERKCLESVDVPGSHEVWKEELSPAADIEQSNSSRCRNSIIVTEGDYPKIQDEDLSRECSTLRTEDHSYDDSAGDITNAQDHSYVDCDGDIANSQDRNNTSTVEQSKFYRQRFRFRKEFQLDAPMKWSDRRHNAIVSENNIMVGRSEQRHYGDNFGTSSRGINGLNRQSRINVAKSSGRNISHKCSEKFYSSNGRMSDRYDFHSCSCSLNNRLNRVSWETKPANKSESMVDTSKQFYRGSKYNHVDFMHECNGRPKSRVIAGNNPGRDLPQTKKVWEPLESHKKYACSNSDSDVTLGSTGQGFQFDPMRSSIDEVDDSGQIEDGDSNLKRNGMAESCQNDLYTEAEGSCSSTEIASEEPGICLISGTALNNSSDPCQGSTSSSDNCSSCLSEGDNNTTSSNRENTESSMSDSEDASQQSEVRDSSTCIDNGLSSSHEAGIEKIHYANDEGFVSRSVFGPPLDEAGGDALGNPVVKIGHNFDDSFSSTNMCSQPQSIRPPVPNQNLQFPVFQTPSAMGYYHQNPVSWPAAPTNGLISFPHPNHYLYAAPLGYSLNEDPNFCLQYGALSQPTPLFNPTAIPVYQPVAKAKGLNTEELTLMSKPASVQGYLNGSTVEGVAPAGTNSKKAALNGEVGHGNSAKLQDSGFSLFHFGGPVALSTCRKPATESPNDDNVGDFNPRASTDQAEKDHGCNKKESGIIEEYNLFAASNTLRFSIF